MSTPGPQGEPQCGVARHATAGVACGVIGADKHMLGDETRFCAIGDAQT